MTEGAAPAPEALFRQARARDQARDYKGALAGYSRLLELDPSHAPALLERGKVRLILGDTAGALADFTRGVELDPRDIRAWYYLGYARAPLDPSGAREAYERACAADARDASEYHYRGMAHEALNRTREAQADFAREKGLSPVAALPDPEADRAGRPSLVGRVRLAPVTWLLVAINVAVMLFHSGLLFKPTSEMLLEAGALERTRVWQGEVWRLLTSNYVHIGLMHLAMNAYALIVLCGLVEGELGSRKFLLAYGATGLAGSAASLLGHHVVSAGASGAIFGIEGVLLALFFHRLGSWSLFFANPYVRRTLSNMGIWFLLGATVMPMDNYAHFGGLAYGWILGTLFLKAPALSVGRRTAAGAGALVLLVGACVTASVPWYGEGRGLSLHEKAIEAFDRQDYARAETLLTETLKTGFDPAIAHYNRALARRSLGKMNEALQDYEEASRLNPRDADTLVAIGNLRRELRDDSGAAAAYTAAIAIDAANPDLYFRRGQSRKELKDPKGALEDFRKALEVAPAAWTDRADAEEEIKELQRPK